jgi:hypothetical protein
MPDFWEKPAQGLRPTLVPDGPESDSELRHGFTLRAINGLAIHTVKTDRWFYAMDFADRVEIAWSAMIEELYTCDERPEISQLMGAAQRAIQRQVQSDRSSHGISNTDGASDAPNFYRYWWRTYIPGPEDRVIERASLKQIWPRLTERQREVLMALAAYGGDRQTAALSLGITYQHFCATVGEARRTFLRFWHEGEQPSRIWSQDRPSGGNPDHTIMTSVVRRRKRAARKKMESGQAESNGRD